MSSCMLCMMDVRQKIYILIFILWLDFPILLEMIMKLLYLLLKMILKKMNMLLMPSHSLVEFLTHHKILQNHNLQKVFIME